MFATCTLYLVGFAGCTSLPHSDPKLLPYHGVNVNHLNEVNEADRLYRLRDYLKAHTAFTNLTQAHPSNAYFWLRLGNCEAQMGRYSEAINALDRARGIEPLNGGISYNLAIAHTAMARDAFARARAQLEENSPLRNEAENNRRLLDATLGFQASYSK